MPPATPIYMGNPLIPEQDSGQFTHTLTSFVRKPTLLLRIIKMTRRNAPMIRRARGQMPRQTRPQDPRIPILPLHRLLQPRAIKDPVGAIVRRRQLPRRERTFAQDAVVRVLARVVRCRHAVDVALPAQLAAERAVGDGGVLELPPAPREVRDAVEGAGVAAVWRVLETGRIRAGEAKDGLTFFDRLVTCCLWGVPV